jgi:glutathione S-transferase
VGAKLYSLSLSHPSHAARLMLERKGIEHEVVDLLPGMHPWVVRLRGFRGQTVPALRIDGRRIQGSCEIARALDELQPEPRLLPSPEVEAAERWGEAALQPLPRRMFRWGAVNRRDFRHWIARDVVGMPAPALMAELNVPLARILATRVGARDESVRASLAQLPLLLDHVDSLIANGTIGGAEPNAADFQIGTTIRVFVAYEDLHERVAARPCGELAMRVLPDYPDPIPAFLPRDWLS